MQRQAILLLSLLLVAAEKTTCQQGDKDITLDNADVLRHPTPKYPLAARREHLNGVGSFFLEIDTISSAVTHVTVSKSIGHTILDQAAISALRQWRFAPHSAVEVSVPINF
jgi:TonB family protein